MKKLLLLLFISLLFTQCNTLEVKSDDEQFNQEYLYPFLDLAKEYDHFIYPMQVTIVYVDELFNLQGEILAGVSNSKEHYIIFNTSHEYWNSEARLILVYHELAHFYLNRDHMDELFSCELPFSIMSLWSKFSSNMQYNYWISGDWRNNEEYYLKELFLGSNVWKEYNDHENILSHDMASPCNN